MPVDGPTAAVDFSGGEGFRVQGSIRIASFYKGSIGFRRLALGGLWLRKWAA